MYITIQISFVRGIITFVPDVIMCIPQVDPLSHQVKLCDFGSAKMLVC